MSEELSEHYRGIRAAKAARLAAGREKETKNILALIGQGFAVEQLTPFHFRVNGMLDLFPTRKLYHDLRTNTRGEYVKALDIVQKVIDV